MLDYTTSKGHLTPNHIVSMRHSIPNHIERIEHFILDHTTTIRHPIPNHTTIMRHSHRIGYKRSSFHYFNSYQILCIYKSRTFGKHNRNHIS